MRPRLGSAGGTERGAYAILYALTVTIFITFAAIVVDISSARLDRRVDRAATDAAALAGADQLNPRARNPHAGCQRAWEYLTANLADLGFPAGGIDPCAGLPSSVDSSTCPLGVPSPAFPAGEYTVTVTWPVAVDSPLLKPDVRPGDLTQSLTPAIDGDDPCARIGVEVTRTRQFFFGGVVGSSQTTTSVHSVARAVPDVLSAVHVVDPEGCQVLTTNDGTSLTVRGYDDPPVQPGAITADSTGSGCDGSQYVIEPGGGSSNRVCVDGPPGPYEPDCNGNGLIRMSALNPSGGNPGRAFNSSLVPSGLAPEPQVLVDGTGTQPMTDTYGCLTEPPPCTTTPNPVSDLVSRLGGPGLPVPYDVPGYLGNPSGFQTLPDGTLVPGFDDCSPGDVYVPPGNWFIDCPSSAGHTEGFVATGTVVFGGGTIVFAGGAAVEGGCLAFNVPQALGATPTCPTDAALSLVPTDAIVYIRGVHLTQRDGGTLLLPRTMVFIKDSHLQIEDRGRLFWTAPTAAGCSDAACEAARFKKIALWSEDGSGEVNLLHGQDRLTLSGVFFAPRTRFHVDSPSGSGGCVQAQLWVGSLSLDGGGQIDLCPDRDTAVVEQRQGSVLIR